MDLVNAIVPNEALPTPQKFHATSQRDQFLMKLCQEFEFVRSNLMICYPSTSLDTCHSELLPEE